MGDVGTTGRVAAAVAVVATALAVPLGSVALAGTQLPLLAVALAAFGVTMWCHRRTPFLTRRVVVVASAALLAVGVATPPRASKDVWAYAMYGRIVVEHHASPYVHRPAEYVSDPALGRMAAGWRHTRSVYGPVFTGVSAAGMATVGASPLAERLFFQLLAALSVMLALAMLARRRADPAALAWIGINPAVIAIVAGGHNDLLVGVGVLAGVMAATSGRPALAGAVLALAALVKVSGLLPLVAVVAWIGVRRGWRSARSATLVAGVTILIGYALAGGTAALRPLRDAASYRTRASIWDVPGSWFGRHVIGLTSNHARTITSFAAIAVVLLAALVVTARMRDLDPAVAAGAVGLVYLLGAANVLPWYAGWAVPVLALGWRSRVAVVVQVQASLLLLVYVDRPGVDPDVLHGVMMTIATQVVPLIEIALLGMLLIASVRRLAPAIRPYRGGGPREAIV